MDYRHRPLRSAILASIFTVAACSSGDDGLDRPDARGPGFDADLTRPDAAPVSCNEGSAQIGGCAVAGSGDSCTGEPDEDSEFVQVEAGEDLGFVLGPQGFQMFPVSLRTSGIDPGDVDNPASTDRPDVTITLVRDNMEQMTRYTGRPTFVSGDGAEMLEATGVFLIVDAPSDELANKFFRAVAEIRDVNGEYRCGSLTFMAVPM